MRVRLRFVPAISCERIESLGRTYDTNTTTSATIRFIKSFKCLRMTETLSSKEIASAYVLPAPSTGGPPVGRPVPRQARPAPPRAAPRSSSSSSSPSSSSSLAAPQPPATRPLQYPRFSFSPRRPSHPRRPSPCSSRSSPTIALMLIKGAFALALRTDTTFAFSIAQASRHCEATRS
ncbi:hypothetical protein PUN28_012988 [Cardiocondyla obscurior]|uniref:Uncharacterized protein n=1 Tax=Cardiocondyla obscurior TaxID=286306 RepID=A0AAW2F620_9HYME